MTSSLTPAWTSLIISAVAGDVLASSGATAGCTTLVAGTASGAALVFSRTAVLVVDSAGAAGAGVNTGTSACARSSSHPAHRTMPLTAKANTDTRNNWVFIKSLRLFSAVRGAGYRPL